MNTKMQAKSPYGGSPEGRHTPGPWKIEPYQFERGSSPIIGHDGDEENAPTLVGWVNERPDHPDARLIAEAPETAAERDRLKEINAELLDACKFALDVATIQAKNPKTTSGTIQTLKDHLEAAISKAEGGE